MFFVRLRYRTTFVKVTRQTIVTFFLIADQSGELPQSVTTPDRSARADPPAERWYR